VDESRRDLIKKGVVAGGIAWTAPVLTTMRSAASAAGTPPPSSSTTSTTVDDTCTFGTIPLESSQEVPPNASTATGSGSLTFTPSTGELCATLTFSGLSSNAIMAHIHGPAPRGMNAGILFPFSDVPSATSGTIGEECFTLSTEQQDQLCTGQLYFNIHSEDFGAGEIRGQIEPV
jgi:hypothetical protein